MIISNNTCFAWITELLVVAVFLVALSRLYYAKYETRAVVYGQDSIPERVHKGSIRKNRLTLDGYTDYKGAVVLPSLARREMRLKSCRPYSP